MIVANRRYSRSKFGTLKIISPLWLTVLWVLTIALALVAMATFSLRVAHAAPRLGSGEDSEGYVAGGEPAAAVSHDEAPASLDSHGRRVKVWSTVLTVGEAVNSGVTHLGYISGVDPAEGELNDTTFTYVGVEYTVNNLFEQSNGAGFQQVVLETGHSLPDDLILRLDDHDFPIVDSRLLGAEKDIHSWVMDSSLGWEEGQTVEAKLLGPRFSDPCLIES